MMAEAWDIRQDMVLYPFVWSAGGESAYDKRMVPGICELLDRRPECGTLVKYQSLMHVRCVTWGPTGQIPGLIDMARSVFMGMRTGMPLTWGEKAHILRPRYKKELDPKRTDGDPIPLEELLLLMDRDESDLPMINRFLDLLRGGPRTSTVVIEGIGDPRATTPFDDAASRADISGLVHRWLIAPDSMMRLAWRSVLEHMVHYGAVPECDGDELPPRRRNAGTIQA